MFLNSDEASEFVETLADSSLRDMLLFAIERPYHMRGDDEFSIDQPESQFDLLYFVETLNQWLLDRRTAVAIITALRGTSIRLPAQDDPRRLIEVEPAIRCIHRVKEESLRSAISSGFNFVVKSKRTFHGAFDLHYFCRLLEAVFSDKLSIVRLLIDGRRRRPARAR